MKNKFLDFLSLSAGERKGVIVLVTIIIILSALQLITVFRKTPPASFSDSSFFKTLVPEDDDESQTTEFTNYHYQAFRDTFELFTFDPNTIDAGDMRRLGISDKVIRTWLNYRLRGGRFYIPGDISKIYGLPAEIAERLIPYATIKNEKTGESSVKNNDYAKKIIVKKDINAGDSIDFLDIPGVGPVLSGRIIKYRNLLGGFWQINQLKEVYGLNDSVLPGLADRFYADTVLLRKISINSAPEALMSRHPYIGRQITRRIVAYRKQAGNIQSIKELVTNGILSEEEYEKLRPYLSL